MTASERYRRGFGLSLLLHATLLGTAWILWKKPSKSTSQEPHRWQVSMVKPPKPPPPPPPRNRPLPQPELSYEPAVASLPPPGPQPATGGAPLPSPGFGPVTAGRTPLAGLPNIGVPVGVEGVGGSGGSGLGGGTGGGGTGFAGPRAAPSIAAPESSLTPIRRIAPTYPIEARRQKLEGWVRVEFTVREDGSVEDITVKGAQPPGVFEQAAIAAIGEWLFSPATENGKPVRKRAAQTLRFELTKR